MALLAQWKDEQHQVRTGEIRDIAIIAASVALISFFLYRTIHLEFMSYDTFHILLKRLYYVPILYAALRFGLKGGLVTSLAVTLLFAPHATVPLGGLSSTGGSVDNLLEILLYNVVGFTTGIMVEVKRRLAHRYQEVLHLNRDIEERETAIRRIQAYTESILSSVSSGIISTDRRGNIVTANPAARRLLDRGEDDLIGFPLAKIFEGQRELLDTSEQILAEQRQRASLETVITAGGSDELPVAVGITPHRSLGETVGLVISLEDLTEVKNLTRQLFRADKLTGLGELVAGVAHEVRNPLGVIKASVQMIDQELEESCKIKATELTRVMVQEIDRLDAVVRALLDFGRPSESQFKPVDPGQVISEVLLLTQHFAHQQQVGVHKSFPDRLPEVQADPDQLKQVFVNLISNAIQAMPAGGELTLAATVRDNYLEISVTDTGAGIPEEEQERIFNPFHTTRADGTGLGLSIVHRIVDAHKGYITIESRVSEGSTFTVGLPLAISPAILKERADA